MNDTSIPGSSSIPEIIARPDRTIVLVGMMGVGKSTVGKRLANRLGVPFIDADAEIEKAAGLTIPEMTVLLGGMRSLGANAGGSSAGLLTSAPGHLNNFFFVNLLSMDTEWSKSGEGMYVGKSRYSGKQTYTATSVDLIFGSNSELRAVAETYASADGEDKFLEDFVAAWTKVMQADMY